MSKLRLRGCFVSIAVSLLFLSPSKAGMEEDAAGPLELLGLAIGCPAAATQEEDRLIQRTYSYGGDHRVFSANLQLKDVTPDGLEDTPRRRIEMYRAATMRKHYTEDSRRPIWEPANSAK